MRFEIPDTYHVTYRYAWITSKRPPKGKTQLVPTMGTTALVYSPDETLIAEGHAIMNPDDGQFCRRIGRAIAHGRAAKALSEHLTTV